jgi:hypothetical protein
MPTPSQDDPVQYGIAELFGRPIDRLRKEERDGLLDQALNGPVREYPECPFRLPSQAGLTRCSKRHGICSIRRYCNESGSARRLQGSDDSPTVTCPYRFHEALTVFRWIARELIRTSEALLVKEVGFLEAPIGSTEEANDDEEVVGRIDMILLDPQSLQRGPLSWCAVELQAVYFSGPNMAQELSHVRQHPSDSIPFPSRIRRPDYRSSAPKRLMSQLQIKVPTLRRWGKKVAVVVDRHFYGWMGQMERERDVSSGDIARFVVDFVASEPFGAYAVSEGLLHLTTLERAVEGLTGGRPLALDDFEERIRQQSARAIHVTDPGPDERT